MITSKASTTPFKVIPTTNQTVEWTGGAVNHSSAPSKASRSATRPFRAAASSFYTHRRALRRFSVYHRGIGGIRLLETVMPAGIHGRGLAPASGERILGARHGRQALGRGLCFEGNYALGRVDATEGEVGHSGRRAEAGHVSQPDVIVAWYVLH